MTPLTAARFDKKCGKSGIPDNAKCSKKTTAKAAPGPELKERAFAVSSAVQTARAGMALYKGNLTAARRRIKSAGKNAAEYTQERGERTGNKKLLAFAAGKNVVESLTATKKAARSLKAGNIRGFSTNLAEAANTGLESFTFNRQRQGKRITGFEEANRNFGDLLQAGKWASASTSATTDLIKSRRSARTRGTRLLKASTWGDPLDLRPKTRRRRDSVWAEGFEIAL